MELTYMKKYSPQEIPAPATFADAPCKFKLATKIIATKGYFKLPYKC